ncbi:MAG: acyl-CoA synthetase [Chloroflexi bacterium]|nr:acyl-CoA synthetase [Chloroflexota bacterium]
MQPYWTSSRASGRTRHRLLAPSAILGYNKPYSWEMALDDIFHPRSIAVVGASSGPVNIHSQMFLDNLLHFKYEGKLYPVNPKFDQISGLRAYPSVRDIPGPVDLVTSLVPASATPQLLQDCVVKKVKAVQLFTAGFDETGEQEGGRLQEELVRIARSGGVRILGPNCVGIYCPESRISYASDFPKEAGKVGFISQSGGYTYLAVRMGALRGLRFSKVVSYGNASDISESELLEYLAHDPDTEIIAAYIEGARDGQRLLRVLTEAAAEKPVIVIKKGRTEAGRRGARSHSAALSGNDTVWDAALRQAGVIRVEDVEELVDVLVTFLFMPRPPGRKVAVLGAGGGASVRASDECEACGLTLPPISDEVKAALNQVIPLAGSMLRNPVDVLAEPHGDSMWIPVLRALDNWDEVDMLLWHFSPEMEPIQGDAFQQFVIEARRGMLDVFKTFRKPKAVAVHSVESLYGLKELDAIRARCTENRIAFYPSVYRAARAISRYIDHSEQRERRRAKS